MAADKIFGLYQRTPLVANTAWAVAVIAIAANNVAQKLPVAPLANRRSVTLVNGSTQALYVGPAGVTGAADGLLVPANGGERTIDIGPDVDIYGVMTANTPKNVTVIELS